MNKKLLSLPALFLSVHAWAQDSSHFKQKQLDEVVVTATKFARKNSETGKVVTVVDRTTLDRSLGKDLSQILTEQAGIVVNGATSNPGKDKSIFLRGAKNDYTVILVNGIPVTDPSGTGGAFDLRMFPVEQIERIEILKGAQSTLYGSDAIAGVINIITRKGGGKPAELYGNLSFGTYGTMSSQAGLSGTAEKVSYNVGFSHHESDGISEAKDTLGTQNFDKDGFVRNAFQFDIDGEVVDGLRVMPFFRYTYFKGGYDAGSFKDAPNQYQMSFLSSGARVQYKFNRGAVNAQYQYDETFRNYDGFTFDGRSHLAEVYAQYNVHKHLQLLAGIDYRSQKMYDTTADPKNPEIKITSPYLSVFLKNLAGFYLEAGVRYNDHNRYGNNFTYSFNPSYLVNENVKVFANIASAFKAPSLASLYGKYGSNKELKPEKSYTYEGGVQASMFNNLVDARVVYFSRHSKDVIVYGPAFTMINLDKQDDQGIEVEPTINITKDIQLKLFYTWTKGEVTTKTGIAGKDTTYDNLLRRPRHSFGANLGYQVTKHLYVSTNVYNYSKRSDLYFDDFFVQHPVTLGAYALWNAYAEYKLANNHIRIFADLKNITNTKYYEVYGYGTLGTNINAGIAIRL